MRDRFEIFTGNKKTRRCGEAQFSRRVFPFPVFSSKITLHRAIPLPRSEVEHPQQKIRENTSVHHKTKTLSAEAGSRVKKRKYDPRLFRIGFHFNKYFHTSLDLLVKCGSDSPDSSIHI